MRVRKLDLNLIPMLHSEDIRAKKRVLSRTLEGAWTALLKGRGMEFAGFRQYTYGDDASMIDWGASLRANETLVKEFEEYRNVNVVFLIDVSDTMLFTSQKKLKAEYAAELAFALAAAILENGDAVGYMMFADKIIAKEMPGIGQNVLYRMASMLMQPKNYGGKKDFKAVVSMLNALLKQRSLIIIISDFIEFGVQWERYVRMLAERYDVIGIMLRDPRDYEIPAQSGQLFVQDQYDEDTYLIDSKKLRDIYAEQAKQEEEYIKRIFDNARVGFVKVSTGGDLISPILEYFRKRRAIIRG